MRVRDVLLVLSSAALAVASPDARADENVGSSVGSVVYGTDDRVDWYAIPSAPMQTLARQSIVALIDASWIGGGGASPSYPPFQNGWPTLDDAITSEFGAPLCAGERFATQPALAFCSGTLIDEDVVLTAGHCITNQTDCGSTRFVFDYLESAAGVRESVGSDDIYACHSILARALETSPIHRDFAIVKLDRPVVGRTPAPVRHATTALPNGTGLVVMGMGSGILLKYDDGGSITDNNAQSLDDFVGTTDTFAGNSGSGVFDDSGTLVGILVSGADDYVPDGSCTSVNILPAGTGFERSTYVFRALDAICSAGYPSAALCPSNPSPMCGDSYCSGTETASSCAVDCVGTYCGDGTCDSDESSSSCMLDCKSTTSNSNHGRCEVSPGTPSLVALETLALVTAASVLVARRRRATARITRRR